ncbi:neogenin-like isoform X5 [Asterias rubens]|uniref:neogenin-like isoform X5 n=1 Tax=Asterias rubens TaxID=7604 RepID=UPI0014558054|nr:neogenin-like isoform X5 [Asterias rubens]
MPNGALRIASVSVLDEGSYRCSADDDYFSKVGTLSIARLELLEGPENIFAYNGDTIFFTCDFDSVPPPQISWLKNGLVLELTEERVSARYTLFPSGGLEIREVRSSDAGTYRCQGTNRLFSTRISSNNALLTINPGANPDFQFIKIPNQEIQAPVGETIVIEVATDSPATFTWFKDDEEIFIVGTDEHYSLVGQGSLRIKQVGEIDTGLYRVIATSQSDGDAEITHIVKVTALVPLKFNIRPRNTYVNIGNDVTLECNVYGIPGPTIEWYHDGEAIEPGDIFEVSPTGSLTIKQAITEDSGIYQCVADNTVENLQALAQLIVVAEGIVIPTRLPVTSAVITAAPLPQITTTSPPARPDLGPVPSEPRFLTASDVQARSFSLSWLEPLQMNGNLNNYRIYLKWDGNLKIESAYDLRAFLSDLAPETRYEVTVFAVNENGDGVESETLIVETLPPGDYLGPPVNIQARAGQGSCTSLLISWEPPQDGEGQNYVVYYADLSGGVAQELQLYTEEEFYIITDLKPYTRYGLRVVANNENGPGASSGNLEARTSQCKPYGFPANITVEADSASAIRVLWNQPIFTERNGLITGYKLKYRTVDNGKRTHTLIIDGDVRSYTIQDLEKETAYEIRMAASNANGTGPFSDWVQIATFKEDKNENTVPPILSLFSAIPSSNKIVVTWAPPFESNIMIRGYILGYGAGIPDAFIETFSSSETQFTITNLKPSTIYVLKLRAFNNAGEGMSLYKDVATSVAGTLGPSPTRTIHVTTRSVPSMPMGLRVVVTSPYSAVASWVDQDYIGQSIPAGRNYTVRYRTNYPSNKYMYINSSDLSVVIDNLNPFTEYQFEVKASDSGEGGGHSPYGLVTTNKTFESAPGSPPRSLTVVRVENSSTALGLNWQPPKNPNGQITGYTIYYSTTNSNDKEEWIMDYITGEDLTRTIHGLTSDTMYYFKIQSHTSRGEGPISDVVSASTPTALIVPPIPPITVPSAGPPLAAAGALGFPWWLWLLIILAILFIIILAVLLLLCFMCGCCAWCARCCPCCAAYCDDICGCCAPICGPIAACFAGCCPCCCEDEDGCAKCWLKFCCGASACVCCGQAYRERKKAKGSANLTGYHAVSQNGKAVGSTPVPPDLWINHEGVEMKVDGKKTGMTLSPINAKSSEREMLNQGKGVDQQREGTQETSFTQSAVQNQQEHYNASGELANGHASSLVTTGTLGRGSRESQIHVSSEDQVHASQRQSQYETPTLISAASHRSSLDSARPVTLSSSPRMENLSEFVTQSEVHSSSVSAAKPSTSEYQSDSLIHSEIQNDDVINSDEAGRTSPRYATWGAKANLNDQQKSSSVNYNSTNIHVEDVRNNYTANDSFSTLRGNGHQGSRGEAYNTLDRQASHNNAYSADNQIITFPETAGGPQPFTITFEETTTSHNVEKSVPLPDGTNFKTSSSHQTFAKSYSTSDASQDQNLQAMLQGGLENGPLAIEIPNSNNTLPAITAAPMFRSGSFNPIPQDSPSSITSHANSRSPPMTNYNFTNSENNSSQTQSSGYTSAGNTRGRASSIGASSIDSMGYRGRRGSENYNSEYKSSVQGTSPINIPPPNPTSAYSSSFQDYASLRREETDKGYGLGRSASDLYNGSSGIGMSKPRAGFNTIDRSAGFNTIDRSAGFSTDSAYGSPTHGSGFTLPSRTGGLTVPEYRPSNSYQSSAFQNSSESQSFGSYGNGQRSGSQSQVSYNNNNASIPRQVVEVDHAEVQTPERFTSKSDLLQSSSYTSPSIPEFTARPLRRSMSVDHEFGLETSDNFWNSGSNTNLSSYHRETKESRESTRGVDSGASESQRGRSRFVGENTYGGVSSRSRSLDRFGEREEKLSRPQINKNNPQNQRHMSPVGGYDYHASSPRQHQMDRPAYMYNTNTTSSGYHSDTNTTSSHDDGSSTQGSTSRAGNPLSSFSVPGPPPNYQAARVKIQAPSYSPLKRNTQPGVARVRAQPLPVVTPRAPDVTYRGIGDGTSPGVSLYQESTNRSFSTEDLNTEMLNLEGLMKDLNAITASELQS